MSEYTALAKHGCAACGAQLEWNPDQQALVCPYCGTVSPVQWDPGRGEVQEIDLVRALREIPESSRGWQAERKSVRCRSCQAVSVFDPERVGQRCDFCGSPELVDYEEIKAPIRPLSLLPFKVGEGRVREEIRNWFASRWLAPSLLGRRALVDRVRGVYLPYWTFDARVVCPWTAEAGYYYYTTEIYRDSQGRLQQRQVRQVRWVPASGQVTRFFDDEPVPASRGVSHRLLKGVEPFPTQELVPYDTAYLSGFIVEHYQVVLVEAARAARQAMEGRLFALCADQVPGDTHRNLRIFPQYSGETFKHILLPVWLLTYHYGSRTYQVLVNGYTGKIAGEYPKSFWKILLLVLSLLVLAALLLLWGGGS